MARAVRSLAPHYPKRERSLPVGVGLLPGFTFCSSGSTCRTRQRWKSRWPRLEVDAAVCGVGFGLRAAPDETTVCKFRRLLEKNTISGNRFWGQADLHLQAQGANLEPARSWTRPSCTRPLRPRIRSRSAINSAPDQGRANNVLRNEGIPSIAVSLYKTSRDILYTSARA